MGKITVNHGDFFTKADDPKRIWKVGRCVGLDCLPPHVQLLPVTQDERLMTMSVSALQDKNLFLRQRSGLTPIDFNKKSSGGNGKKRREFNQDVLNDVKKKAAKGSAKHNISHQLSRFLLLPVWSFLNRLLDLHIELVPETDSRSLLLPAHKKMADISAG